MELSPFTVVVLLSFVIPLLTGALTKLSAPDLLKGAVSLTLSFAASVIGQAVGENGGAVWSQETLRMTALSYAIQLTNYLGIYKPLKVNQRLAPDKGIG